jgi:hypothetical protein
MSAKREDILASAVKFLQDPKVQASSLGKKVAFLESKGLTSEEIEEAMQRANGTAPAATAGSVSTALVPGQPQQQMMPYPGQQVMMAPPPLPPKYDWKDMFIAAVVAGGFSYGMWQVAKVNSHSCFTLFPLVCVFLHLSCVVVVAAVRCHSPSEIIFHFRFLRCMCQSVSDDEWKDGE